MRRSSRLQARLAVLPVIQRISADFSNLQLRGVGPLGRRPSGKTAPKEDPEGLASACSGGSRWLTRPKCDPRLAEAHGNRTHPRRAFTRRTTVLKTAGGTSPRALPLGIVSQAGRGGGSDSRLGRGFGRKTVCNSGRPWLGSVL